MASDERRHPRRVGLGILAERPADALAQEEFRLADGGPDRIGQKRGVRRLPGLELSEYRGPPLPDVVVMRPFAQRGLHRAGMGREHGAHAACGDRVHVVPPGAGHHQLLDQRKPGRLEPARVSPEEQELDRRVAFLPVGGVVPEVENRRLPCPGVRQRVRPEHGVRDAPALRHAHAEEGHGGLHVRLLLRRPGRIGGVAEGGRDGLANGHRESSPTRRRRATAAARTAGIAPPAGSRWTFPAGRLHPAALECGAGWQGARAWRRLARGETAAGDHRRRRGGAGEDERRAHSDDARRQPAARP